MEGISVAGADIMQQVIEETYLDPNGKAWKSKEERIEAARKIALVKLKELLRLKAIEVSKLQF